MGPLVFPNDRKNAARNASSLKADSVDWVGVAAGGSLIAAGLLLLTGQRRAGIAAAATGTTLALLEQEELLRSWWTQLPGYVDQVQAVIGQVRSTVEDLTALRDAPLQPPIEAEREG